MSHHDKSGPRLDARTQLIHITVIEGLDLTALVTDNMVMVMCIIRMRWLVPRIPLGEIDPPCKALCLKQIDKAIGRNEIDRFRVGGRLVDPARAGA